MQETVTEKIESNPQPVRRPFFKQLVVLVHTALPGWRRRVCISEIEAAASAASVAKPGQKGARTHSRSGPARQEG